MTVAGLRQPVATSVLSGSRLNEAQLSCIADIVADILAADPAPSTVAIPFLHVQSAHPNVLMRYEDALLRSGRDWRNEIQVALARVGIPMLSILQGPPGWSGDPLPEKTDVLFVSHFLRASDASGGSDLYFGDLPERLGRAGVSATTALIDHSRQPWRKLSKKWRAGPTPRRLLRRRAGIAAELAIARELRRAAKRLRRQPVIGPLQGAITAAAAARATGPGSRTALRLAGQIGELVRHLKPKALVTTFEGHSWERLVYAAAREADPNILCIGYSHAVLFPFQRAMALQLGHGYDPDVILTAGDVTRDHLRREPSLAGIPIDTLGSVRRSEVAAPGTSEREAICLVLPEGIVSECVCLIRVAAATALLAPDIRFRIRLHPLVKRDEIIGADRAFTSLPANIEWSVAPLDDDLQQSRWTIYRGSSAVIQAVRQSVRPFYFAAPSEPFDIDPIASLSAWRERFTTPDELATALLLDRNTMPTEQQMADERFARDFCDRYFMPMHPEILVALIKRRGVD